jgi:hypothetical protein
MTETSIYDQTVWGLLNLEDADDAELSALLEVMVLLGDAPPDFIAELSPQHAEVVTRGRQLRTQLPSYLEQQRALVHAHCPLPVVLQPLVAAYAVPTSEDIWTDGLRVWVVECSTLSCRGAGLLRCTACKQAWYCGQPCQRAHWKAHKVECKRLCAEIKALQTNQGARGI